MRPALVLVPGLMSDARLWRDQVEGLGDLAEPWVADVTLGGGSMAGMARAVLEGAPEGPFALAGLSMGGFVALEVHRAAPERVLGLALLGTSARADTPEQREGRLRLVGLARGGRFEEVPRVLFPRVVAPSRLGDEGVSSVFWEMARDTGAEAFVGQQEAMMGRTDARGRLAEISCPTLVLCGRDDALTPPRLSEEISASVPGAELVLLDDCGHLSTLERPDAVTDAMRGWLGRAVSGGVTGLTTTPGAGT